MSYFLTSILYFFSLFYFSYICFILAMSALSTNSCNSNLSAIETKKDLMQQLDTKFNMLTDVSTEFHDFLYHYGNKCTIEQLWSILRDINIVTFETEALKDKVLRLGIALDKSDNHSS